MVYLAWLVVKTLNMELLSSILGQFIGIGVLAVLIVFQPEIRRFLLYIGRSRVFTKDRSWRSLLKLQLKIPSEKESYVTEISKACKRMSKTKTGALIVFAKTSRLQFFANTGTSIGGYITAELLESIFMKNSALHDGAVIIADLEIVAARCILPVSENPDLPTWAGLRHRSAIGITEHSDAIAIIISEETGEYSYAEEGKLHARVSAEELNEVLHKALLVED